MKKKVALMGCGSWLLPLFLLFFPLLILFNDTTIQDSASSHQVVDGVTYVEHWTNGDAYTHNFLHQRYGITASQIDGFIQSQGFSVDQRASGKNFLELQAKSGIDVRVLVAIAQMESGYGTAGVAKQFPHANLFGYGAFDSNPNNGANWTNEEAVLNFREYQVDTLGNTSFQIMDERALQYALNALPVGKGIYYTDTSGTGKVRAGVMEQFDRYIDEHGGTPKPPAGTTPIVRGDGLIASSWEFPSEYAGKLKYGQPSTASMTTQAGSGYPPGQCTWYVYNRLMETGIITAGDGYGYLGNGQDWVNSLVARGWKRVSKAEVGGVVSMTYGQYGHVVFIEHVNPDGSFLVSECNYAGNQTQVHFRVIVHEPNYSYAVRN